jgi:hypothetical protein
LQKQIQIALEMRRPYQNKGPVACGEVCMLMYVFGDLAGNFLSVVKRSIDVLDA